jgi:5-methylcytosine-specific restriction protein A
MWNEQDEKIQPGRQAANRTGDPGQEHWKNGRMTAIILAWDPDRRNGWTHAAAVELVTETGQCLATWNAAGQGDIPSGTEAWLWLRARTRSGLLGHGTVVSEDLPAETPGGPPLGTGGEEDAPATAMRHIRVAFDALLPVGDQVPPRILAEAVPGLNWDGQDLPDVIRDAHVETSIRNVWKEFGPAPASDPTYPVPGTYPEKAVSRVQVNRNERSPDARRICVAHHGESCAACGFSFETAYGEVGRGFIQVHHIVPASQIGGEYQLDPVADLVPLCPNCHAMAHLGVGTPRTVAELRRIMAGAGYLAGQTVAPEELEAQRNARRILEQQQ